MVKWSWTTLDVCKHFSHKNFPLQSEWIYCVSVKGQMWLGALVECQQQRLKPSQYDSSYIYMFSERHMLEVKKWATIQLYILMAWRVASECRDQWDCCVVLRCTSILLPSLMLLWMSNFMEKFAKLSSKVAEYDSNAKIFASKHLLIAILHTHGKYGHTTSCMFIWKLL